MRAPQLYPLLRGFVLGSFVVLGASSRRAPSSPSRSRSTSSGAARRCTSSDRSCARSSRSASRCSRAREDARLAVEELRREPAAAIFAKRPRGQARERGRGALPHRSSSACSSRPRRHAAASTGTTRRSRRHMPSSRRRSTASGAGTSPSRLLRDLARQARRARAQVSPFVRTPPMSWRRTGRSRAGSFPVTSDASPIA